MIDYTLIQSEKQLAQICNALRKEKMIAVDLEADSMHHFKEKVCLVQMAGKKHCYLLDPLAITDFSRLKLLFEDQTITKVFHGSDFDIRSLDRDFDIQVNPIFDTEIACRFLGVQKRSLAALLAKQFNVIVDKRFQKTDWSIRPLSEEMITYSLTDVAYLMELKERLEQKLKTNGRLAWAQEEFALQAAVRYESNGNQPLFLKFKGAGKIHGKSLAVLENLLQMRRKISEKKDRPLYKVIGAEAITRLTVSKPKSMNQLKQSRALSPRQTEMYGKHCLEAIIKGLETPTSHLPVYPKKRSPRLSPLVPERIKALKKMRIAASNKTGIEPGFLLNNSLISSIAVTLPESRKELETLDGVRKWQIEVLEQDILNIIQQSVRR